MRAFLREHALAMPAQAGMGGPSYVGVGGTGGGGGGTTVTPIPIVANIAALSALSVSSYINDQPAIVQSVKDLWSLQPAASVALDGITAVAASDGRVWQRSITPLNLPQNTKTLGWWIDPVAGNDENSGAALGSPLKTVAELARRYGTNYPVTGAAAVVVTILNNVPSTDPWTIVPLVDVANGGSFTVTAPLVVAVTTATNGYASPTFSGTPTKWHQTASGQPANFWTAHVGKLVHNATKGAWYRVFADLGTEIAEISSPVGLQAGPGGAPPFVNVGGDLSNVDIIAPGPTLSIAVAETEAGLPYLTFQLLTISGGFPAAINANFDRCQFAGSVTVFAPQSFACVLANCDVDPTSVLQGHCTFYAGQTRNGSNVTIQGGTSLDTAPQIDGDVLFGGTLYVEGWMRLGGAGFFDAIYADKTRQPNTVILAALAYAVARQWGTASFNVAEGSQIGLGQTAVSSLLLTGAYTIDGVATAFQWNAATNAFLAAVAVTPANIDAKGNLQNPATGSRVYVRT